MKSHCIKDIFFMVAVVIVFVEGAVQRNTKIEGLMVVSRACELPCDSHERPLSLS